MPELWLRDTNDTSVERVTSTHPLPTKVTNLSELASLLTWKQRLAFQGRCFQVSVGTFSTPVAGGGATAVLDQDQPQVAVSVPTGTVILPTRIRVDCQTPLIAADNDECEILVAVDRVTAVADGSSTTETPLNLRTDLPRASNCTVRSDFTGNITVAPTLHYELLHPVIVADVQGTPATALWGSLYADYEPVVAGPIFGPATLLVYWGGTVAVNGFASIEWAEFSADEARSF